jgi:purine-binding chemotaxis protein CheW
LTTLAEISGLTTTGKAEMPGGTRQFVTFRVGPLFMGIELCRIQELMRSQEMATVPLAPAAIEGLINLRGQIVTALDMRKILGLVPLAGESLSSMNIVVHSEGGPVSLLVDQICDVIDVTLLAADQAFPELPENLPPEQRAMLNGVYQMESGLLLVMNTEQVILAGSL